ncbi:MAG: hypothetical protein MJ188_05750 [Treponema sp.]|nr:hypothetical protein [Treponema sp.]
MWFCDFCVLGILGDGIHNYEFEALFGNHFCNATCLNNYKLQKEREKEDQRRIAQEKKDTEREDIAGLIEYLSFYTTHPITNAVFPEVREAYNKAMSYMEGNYDYSIKSKLLILQDIINQLQGKYNTAKIEYQPIQDRIDRDKQIVDSKRRIEDINKFIKNGGFFNSPDNLYSAHNTGVRMSDVNLKLDLERNVLNVGYEQICNTSSETINIKFSVRLLDSEEKIKLLNGKSYNFCSIYETEFELRSNSKYSFRDKQIQIPLDNYDFDDVSVLIFVYDEEYGYVKLLFSNLKYIVWNDSSSEIKSYTIAVGRSKNRLLAEIAELQNKIKTLEAQNNPQNNFQTSNNINLNPAPEVSAQPSNAQPSNAQSQKPAGEATNGEDLECDLIIDAALAKSGGEVAVNIERKELCDYCKGTGKMVSNAPGFFSYFTELNCLKCSGSKYLDVTNNVTIKIPAEVKEGQIFRLKGMGYPGINGGLPGHYYLRVVIK